MSVNIKFGTDGWRGVIADDFTMEGVEIVSLAVANYLKEEVEKISRYKTPKIIVGYDARFLSERFAKRCAEVISSCGIKVYLTEMEVPTPVISYTIIDKKLDGGVVITASHNPPKFNGFKFKPYYGGSATPQITKAIENKIKELETKDRDRDVKGTNIKYINPVQNYYKHLFSLLDTKSIRGANLKVVIDPMHGAGRVCLEEVLKMLNCEVINIAGNRDPLFGGRFPEPIPPHINSLMKAVKEYKADLGLALDGDADRIGAVEENGNFLDSHRIFSLLLNYLVNHRKEKGEVVKTVSTTSLIEKIASSHNLKLWEVPVGFKYICDLMLKRNVLIGGEESGGLGFKGHIPERDGIYSGLLLCEMVAKLKSPIGEIYKSLTNLYGEYHYHRFDMEIENTKKKRLVEHLKSNSPNVIAGLKVISINRLDGFKYILPDSSFLMIRPSGTEPLLRIYAESPHKTQLKRIIKFGKELVEKF